MQKFIYKIYIYLSKKGQVSRHKKLYKNKNLYNYK